jgi:hypothetical protein
LYREIGRAFVRVLLGKPPHPRVFLRKSSESLEKKGVEIGDGAKEFARV